MSCVNTLRVKIKLEIDARSVEEAVRLSGKHTESAAIEAALSKYVQLRRKELLLELPGNIDLDDNWRDLRAAELDE